MSTTQQPLGEDQHTCEFLRGYKPKRGYCFIEPWVYEPQGKSGIVLPDVALPETNVGTILEMDPEDALDFDLLPGDAVLYVHRAAFDVDWSSSVKLLRLTEATVLAVIEEDDNDAV